MCPVVSVMFVMVFVVMLVVIFAIFSAQLAFALFLRVHLFSAAQDEHQEAQGES